MSEEKISEHLQDSLVLLSIIDTDFAKAIGGQVPPEFFESEVASEVYKISVAYTKKYGESPGDHFHDELLKLAKKISPDKTELILRYLLYLEKMRVPNKEYVKSRLNDFIKSRTLIGATYKFANLVEKGQFDNAANFIYNALKVGIKEQNIGIDYFEKKDLKQRGDYPEVLFSTGISVLDKYTRIGRTDLIALAAPYKGGKSWFGHFLGSCALKQGLKILHVSHENSLEETTIRYDQIFGSLLNEKERRNVEIRRMKNGRIVKEKIERTTVYDKRASSKARDKLSSYGGKLIIQKYSMGECSPIKLESYINYLENFENFLPDIVITDYADIMAPIDNKKQTRDAINEVYIYLKRIADDKKLVMITMSQINDEGIKCLINRGKLEGRHLAEDKRKFANIDKGFFIGTPSEFEGKGEVVIGCFANRNGQQGQRCIVGQNLDIGQFFVYERPYKTREREKE